MTSISSNSTPSKEATITLREVDKDNWVTVAELKPGKGRRGNVEKNIWSICSGQLAPDTFLRAVYADETPVGLLLMEICDSTDTYFIWRFMIDGQYQKLGYGQRSIRLAIAHVRQHHPQAKRMTLCSTPPEGKGHKKPKMVVRPEDSPFKFYEKLGFKQIEPPDEDNETLMALDL